MWNSAPEPWQLCDRGSPDVDGVSRLTAFGHVRRIVAGVAKVVLRLWPRRTTIHITDVSEKWIADHQTETPKHDQEV